MESETGSDKAMSPAEERKARLEARDAEKRKADEATRSERTAANAKAKEDAEAANRAMAENRRSNAAAGRTVPKDLKTFGDHGWVLVARASSESEGWVKSTEALDVIGGGLIKTSTRIMKDGDDAAIVTESVVFIPKMKIRDSVDRSGKLVKRQIVVS